MMWKIGLTFARAVFVTIDGKVHKLLTAMYGLLDVGAVFDRKVLNVMNLMGSVMGQVQHLCCIPGDLVRDKVLCFYHATTALGHDFVVVGMFILWKRYQTRDKKAQNCKEFFAVDGF